MYKETIAVHGFDFKGIRSIGLSYIHFSCQSKDWCHVAKDDLRRLRIVSPKCITEIVVLPFACSLVDQLGSHKELLFESKKAFCTEIFQSSSIDLGFGMGIISSLSRSASSRSWEDLCSLLLQILQVQGSQPVRTLQFQMQKHLVFDVVVEGQDEL